MRACFAPPPYAAVDDAAAAAGLAAIRFEDRAFDRWVERSVNVHRVPGYAIVSISLKPTGVAPGDATDTQMELIADLADEYSFGEVRVTHEQNLVLADVRKEALHALWQRLRGAGLALHGSLP